MKVFCDNCEHFDSRHAMYEKCLHPENQKVVEIKETYSTPKSSYKTSEFDPCQLNSENDCKWFEPNLTNYLHIKLTNFLKRIMVASSNGKDKRFSIFKSGFDSPCDYQK